MGELSMKRKQIIARDNKKKLSCLRLLQIMCNSIMSDVRRIDEHYDVEGAIDYVTVYFYDGAKTVVSVWGDSPLTMVREIIKNGHLE